MVHKIWIFKEKHVFILYYFVLIKAGKGLIARQISHYNFIYGLVFYDCCTYNYTIILLGTEIVLILAYLFLQHVSTLSFVDHPFP